MVEPANTSLSRSPEAFVERDAAKAKRIAQVDREVDAVHDRVVRHHIGRMIDDPNTIQREPYPKWGSHNLGRIVDRVPEICERVVYIVSGEMEAINASKY